MKSRGAEVKRCGTSEAQILRGWGGMVSSSLLKPSVAHMGVVRGVTEHSKWTSQTLRGAGSGLPLMLADLASGTERKCCRTRRGIVDHSAGLPVSRLIVGGKGE